MLKANVRWAITGALLLILFGNLQGCASDPTSVAHDDDPRCVMIDGVWICT